MYEVQLKVTHHPAPQFYYNFEAQPLPGEILLHFCSYLKLSDLGAFICVNKRHYTILNQNASLFKSLFLRYFPILLATEYSKLKPQELYPFFHDTVLSTQAIFPAIARGKFCFIPLLFCSASVSSFVSNERFLCTIRENDGNLIEVWNWNTQQIVFTYLTTSSVELLLESQFLCLRMQNDHLEVWDLDQEHLCLSLNQPFCTVRIKDNCLYTAVGDFDKKSGHVIEEWNLATGETRPFLTLHNESFISSVGIEIISGSLRTTRKISRLAFL
jgi:hypothetical protein